MSAISRYLTWLKTKPAPIFSSSTVAFIADSGRSRCRSYEISGSQETVDECVNFLNELLEALDLPQDSGGATTLGRRLRLYESKNFVDNYKFSFSSGTWVTPEEDAPVSEEYNIIGESSEERDLVVKLIRDLR